MATMAYGHLSYQNQIYLSLFLATFFAVNDECNNDIGLARGFSLRFIKGEKHGHVFLDAYDMILRELPDRFEQLIAEAMVQSALDFFVRVVFEYERTTLAAPAKQSLGFLRGLGVISRFYALTIFPEELRLQSWMEAIPASIEYIDGIHTIFSFYKHELDNDVDNYISPDARSRREEKLEALQSVANKTVHAHRNALTVLSHNREAREAFQRFCRGYVFFHLSSKRFKVADLWAKGAPKTLQPTRLLGRSDLY